MERASADKYLTTRDLMKNETNEEHTAINAKGNRATDSI